MAAPSSEISEDENKTIPVIKRMCCSNDACFRYIPLAGGASALGFSTYIANPRLFRTLFGDRDYLVANGLWLNAHLGVGLYMYSRKHMRQAGAYQRIMFSVYGAVLFNFGTVLFWATTKSLLPRNNIIRTLFGIGSGIALFAIGKEYLEFIDSSCEDVLQA